MNMEDKYAEIVAKHGPLFKNLIYLERLNLEETSLVREKWTTELFKEDVEVMPIIFEDEENLQQDYYEEKMNEVHSIIPSGQDLGIEQLNLNNDNNVRNFPSSGEAWWITLNDDNASEEKKCISESPTEPMVNLMASSKVPVPTSVILETTCLKTAPFDYPVVKDDMKLVAEQPSDDERDEICMIEQVYSTEKRVQTSNFGLQNNEVFSYLFDQPVASVEYSLEENNIPDTIELKLPCPVSPQTCLHELESGRISRPLSGRYTFDKKDEKSLKNVKRTESIMDLTSHGDMENLSLSSMYDDLCAANIEKKLKLKTKRPKTAISFREMSRELLKSSLIATSSGQNKITEENCEGILEPGVDSTGVSPSSAFGQKQKLMFAANIPHEFRPTLEKKMDQLPKKRPHPDESFRKNVNNSSTESGTL